MNKKNLKGMTLVEIIVSLAIFAMLGMILVTLGMNVDTTTRSAGRLNKRVAIQAPYAASQDTEYSYEQVDEEGNVHVIDDKLTPHLTNIEIYIDEDDNGTADVVSVKRTGASTREDINSDTIVYGGRYNTKAVVDNDSNSDVYDSDDVSNANHHLQFISVFDRIEPPPFTLLKGATAEVTYPSIDEDGNAVELHPSNAVWSTSESGEDVATITPNGVITAVDVGQCVYVGEADGGIKMTITINVVDE